MAVIITDSCIGCESCIPICPFDALGINGEGKLVASKEKCTECGKCVSVCPVSALNISGINKKANDISKNETKEGSKASKSEKPTGDVWVFAEQLEGKLSSVTLELIGAARKLASKLEVKVCTVLLGDKVESIIPELFAYGADTIYVIDDEVFHFYRAETYNRAFCYLIDKYKP